MVADRLRNALTLPGQWIIHFPGVSRAARGSGGEGRVGTKRSGSWTALRGIRRPLLGLAALALLVGGTSGTQDAVANGDTRTLSFYHVHSKETASVTFRRNGSTTARRWRSSTGSCATGAATRPPRWTRASSTSSGRSTVRSARPRRSHQLRLPLAATNGMLRRRSRAVSKHSQHMNGRAMDFYLPDVDMSRVRAVAMRLQQGGSAIIRAPTTPSCISIRAACAPGRA
jgi:hypothetical protein